MDPAMWKMLEKKAVLTRVSERALISYSEQILQEIESTYKQEDRTWKDWLVGSLIWEHFCTRQKGL